MSRDHGEVKLEYAKIAERILIEGYNDDQQQGPLYPRSYSHGGLWKRSFLWLVDNPITLASAPIFAMAFTGTSLSRCQKGFGRSLLTGQSNSIGRRFTPMTSMPKDGIGLLSMLTVYN